MWTRKIKIISDVNGSDDLFLNVIRTIIGDADDSLIDLCCNTARLTRYLEFKNKVYVDILNRDLQEENSYFIQTDVLDDHPIFHSHYDVSVCLDGIEHLNKDQGVLLIEKMLRISEKRIIFTPLDPWMMDADNPHPETHKSLWTPDDLPDWASIVYPVYHPTLNIGAWFGWHCDNLDGEFERVCRQLYN